MNDVEVGGALLGVVFSRLSSRERLVGGQTINRRLRTVMRSVMRDDAMLRLIYLVTADRVSLSVPDIPGEPSAAKTELSGIETQSLSINVPAIGDGAILDQLLAQLGEWFRYIIDNQDQILSLIEAIIAIFTKFGV